MDKKVLVRINSLLKHIDLVLRDTEKVDVSNLKESDVLFRATCFSISQIGEQMVQLEKKIGNEYPQIPWLYARTMRNFLVHDYDHVDIEVVKTTIDFDLPSLKESFLIVKKDYDEKDA